MEDAPGDPESPVEGATTDSPAGGAQIANAEIAGVADARGADFSGAWGADHRRAGWRLRRQRLAPSDEFQAFLASLRNW